MCEAQDGVAVIEDVDEQTFIRFCEYAYTGDYASADHEIMLDSSMVGREDSVSKDGDPVPAPAERSHQYRTAQPEDPVPELAAIFGDGDSEDTINQPSGFSSWSMPSRHNKKGKRCSNCGYFNDIRCRSCDCALEKVHDEPPPKPPSQKQVLWDKFQSRYYPVSTPDFKPRKNVVDCDEYTEVFLSHARVYVFGDKYDIEKLRGLALHKLHKTLQVFHIFHKRIGDIVELVRYSYDNTRDTDDLRDLVTHYVACNFEDMARNESFLALMEGGGAFIRDITDLLLKRIG
jgi:hypothetical protein